LEEAWEIRTNSRLRNAVEKHGWEIVDHYPNDQIFIGDYGYYLYRQGSKGGEVDCDFYSARFNQYEHLKDDEMDDIGMPQFFYNKKDEIRSKIDKIKRYI